jgi:hypothetical protein
LRPLAALKRKFDFSAAVTPPKRPEQVMWVAVLSRAVLDVRHGTEQEARAVLGWIERDREEFEQVVMLAGLESGHAERFVRAMREAFAGRSRGTGLRPAQDRVADGIDATA